MSAVISGSSLTDHHSPVTQLLMTRPRDEWRHDVTSRYRALEQFSKEDARLQFLRILRSLPYGMLSSMAELLHPDSLLHACSTGHSDVEPIAQLPVVKA